MKKISVLARIAVLVCMVSAPVFAWASSGYFSDVAGSVTIAVGKDDPHDAKISDKVASGSVIKTGENSHAVLKFPDGQMVSMQDNSSLMVLEYNYNAKDIKSSSIFFSMFSGGMHFLTGKIGHGYPSGFRLLTPNATIKVRGTEFYTVLDNGTLYNKVLSGSIDVINSAGSVRVKAGKTIKTSSPIVKSVNVAPGNKFNKIAKISFTPPVLAAIPATPPAAPIPPSPPAPPPAAAMASVAPATPEPIVIPPSSPVLEMPATPPPAPASALATSPAPEAAAGGAAAGSSPAVANATGGEEFSMSSGTMVGIGLGVAVGVGLISNASSTSHH